MTVRLVDRGIRVVLLDIEGTTTPLAFVHDVLFPFARAHLATWCRQFRHSAAFAEVARRLSVEHAEDRRRGEPVPPWPDGTAPTSDRSFDEYVLWLMDRDRKSPGLKLLQGLIWEQGYQSGALRGEVYDDVAPAIGRWRAAGVDVAIYSSGSELAQRRLFASTGHGDLTPFIAGFFDTAVGAKRDPLSYARIAGSLGRATGELLFVSDVAAELAAARSAGCHVVLSSRPGNPDQPDAAAFDVVESFDEIS